MKSTLIIAALLIVTFGSGVAVHAFLSANGGGLSGASTDGAAPAGAPVEDEQAGHENHVVLTPQAVQNLDLDLEPLAPSQYTSTLKMPGEVVEQPGHSAHKAAAPVNGIVERIVADPGMVLSPGDPLLRLQVVDEAVFSAQLELLEAMTRLEIVGAELNRLAPLAGSGAVAGRKRLELEYERKQLLAKQEIRKQELYARGLTTEQVEQIMRKRQLLKEITVRVPPRHHHRPLEGETQGLAQEWGRESFATGDSGDDSDAFQSQKTPESLHGRQEEHEPTELDGAYTVEQLLVDPGQTVARGEPLCDLAYHAELYVRGQAFESEIDAVSRANALGLPVAAEFGTEGNTSIRDGLQIRYVANHVDPETQTFLFYMPLDNDVLRETTNEAGQRFRTWRYKVGQRVRVIVPVEQFPQGLVLPQDAVVREGPNAYVFRRLAGHDHAEHEHEDHVHEGDAHDHSDHDHAHGEHENEHDSHPAGTLELERVPVAVDYEDSDVVILANDGQVRPGDVLAMNQAYQLLLTLKSQHSDGGAGHHHGHAH